MRYLITGDLHAKWHDLNSVMKNVDFNLKIRYDAVIQVGDFGFYPLYFDKLDRFHEKLVKNKSEIGCTYEYSPLKFHRPVYAIDGNHENHEWLKKADANVWKEKYNIIYQPRGSFLDIDGFKIGFMGGALNADRRQEGSINKKTTNFILNDEATAAIDLWNSIGGVDVVISHSCPNRLGIGMEGHPALFMTVQRYCVEAGHDPGETNDCGDSPLRVLYRGLEKKPAVWFYGHFHKTKHSKIGTTDFLCVGCVDSSDGKKYINPIILDTKTGKIEKHDKMAMNFDGEHSTYLA